ncbi:MAG: dockerin type I repeat-containing protein, partial [Oscillospiraceae bacterium]|nr:dockerin type I repeat-containing protein [Oscillospiraceae bacterium]
PTSYFRAKADSTCIIKGQYIYGLKTNLTTAQLKALYLDYYNVELTIVNPKGYRYLGTGSTVTVKYPDGKEEVYTIVIYGDIDGDGKIVASDAAMLSSYVAGQYTGEFTTAQKVAANVDGSRRIDASDVAIISAASAGKKEINQTGATK